MNDVVFWAVTGLAFVPALICALAYLAGAHELRPTPEQRARREQWQDRFIRYLLGGGVVLTLLMVTELLIYLI